MPSELLTHSSRSSYGACPRRYQWEYEIGIRPDRPSAPLRVGSVVHDALDDLRKGVTLDMVLSYLRQLYVDTPEWADPFEWAVECVTVVELVNGYAWRWQDDGLTVIESEAVFNLPIVNPETDCPTPNFRQAGKRDAIVRDANG